jgi:NADH dehydrogenase FAD-containing subunit
MMNTKMKKRGKKSRLVVIGGGISGVCCAKELARLHPDEAIVLISASDVLIEVTVCLHLSILLKTALF